MFNTRTIVDRAISASGIRTPGFLTPRNVAEEPAYSPTPVMAEVDDLNRRIAGTALSQASQDFAIHKLMFTPVSDTKRRPAQQEAS